MQGTIVLGISPDSRESHCRFRDKHDLKVLLLSDVEHRILETYGVWVQKKQAGKSHFRVERTTVLIGPDGMVRTIWNNVKVPDHIESVLEKIKSMRN
jgi:peroxiredoxin Q/BCP